MSRKDYEAIAAVFKANKGDEPTRQELAKDLADLFKADNPNFNRERFLQACEVPQ